MDRRSTERRVVVSLVASLITIQVLAFLLLHVSNRQAAAETMSGVLDSGVRVTLRVLEARQRRLDETATLLAGDFGLRDAIASGDPATIHSMLENHARRTGGMTLLVFNREGSLLASYPESFASVHASHLIDDKPERRPFNVAPLDESGKSIVQLGIVKVRAPVPIASVIVALTVNNEFVDMLTKMSSMRFMFLSRTHGGPWRTDGNNLPDDLKPALLGAVDLGSPGISSEWRIQLNDENYLLAPVQLHDSPSSKVMMIVGQSLELAITPLRQVEQTMIVLLLGSLLLSAGAFLWVTRRIVTPIDESANVDVLTGLSNRRHFESAFAAMTGDGRRQARLAVMMMDLNKFKAINDTLGHAVGDGKTLSVGVSIGVALSPDDGTEPAALMERADRAMYHAKVTGSGFAFFSEVPADTGDSPTLVGR